MIAMPSLKLPRRITDISTTMITIPVWQHYVDVEVIGFTLF